MSFLVYTKPDTQRSDTIRPRHREKSSDLRRRLKTVSDDEEVTLDGRLFHTREAVTGNER